LKVMRSELKDRSVVMGPESSPAFLPITQRANQLSTHTSAVKVDFCAEGWAASQGAAIANGRNTYPARGARAIHRSAETGIGSPGVRGATLTYLTTDQNCFRFTAA